MDYYEAQESKVSISSGYLIYEIILLSIIAISVFISISIFSFDPTDPGWTQTPHLQKPIANLAGQIGAYTADSLFFLFGQVTYSIPFLLIIFSILCWRKVFIDKYLDFFSLSFKLTGLILIILSSCVLASLNMDDSHNFSSGGIIGNILLSLTFPFLNSVGTTLLMLFLWILSFSLLTQLSPLSIAEKIGDLVLLTFTFGASRDKQVIDDLNPEQENDDDIYSFMHDSPKNNSENSDDAFDIVDDKDILLSEYTLPINLNSSEDINRTMHVDSLETSLHQSAHFDEKIEPILDALTDQTENVIVQTISSNQTQPNPPGDDLIEINTSSINASVSVLSSDDSLHNPPVIIDAKTFNYDVPEHTTQNAQDHLDHNRHSMQTHTKIEQNLGEINTSENLKQPVKSVFHTKPIFIRTKEARENNLNQTLIQNSASRAEALDADFSESTSAEFIKQSTENGSDNQIQKSDNNMSAKDTAVRNKLAAFGIKIPSSNELKARYEQKFTQKQNSENEFMTGTTNSTEFDTELVIEELNEDTSLKKSNSVPFEANNIYPEEQSYSPQSNFIKIDDDTIILNTPTPNDLLPQNSNTQKINESFDDTQFSELRNVVSEPKTENKNNDLALQDSHLNLTLNHNNLDERDIKQEKYQHIESESITYNDTQNNIENDSSKTASLETDQNESVLNTTEYQPDLFHPFLVRATDNDLEKPKEPLPTLDLLYEAPNQKIKINEEELRNTAQLIENTLADFRIKVTVVEICTGPVITRFELELAPGVKVSRISTLDRDLARALSVSAVRVVEVIPGKPYVGLELPNPIRQTLVIRDVLNCDEFISMKSPLAMVLGKDIAGEPVVANLAKMPHLLVAGTTGSGKSVGVNAMIISILYKASPEDVRFIMIDPKMLELSVYEGIPHLLTNVVTDMKDASNALRWCVAEMDRRYKLMAALGVRNLDGYNEKIAQAAEMERPIPDPFWKPSDSMGSSIPYLIKLPFIVVIVDEFADLMMTEGKKVEELIARLAQKARAAGIHLVLATQRPSVDVITGLIKANIPTRIAFTVSSKIDSRTILDQGGAESLLGAGDMLYLPPNSSTTIRVHGAFVRDEEVHKVVANWKARGKPQYIDAITAGDKSGESDNGNNSDELLDPVFDQAVEFVIEKQRVSISALQRKFRVGFNRAAAIVEQMEEQGIVSAPGHNGNREVLAQ